MKTQQQQSDTICYRKRATMVSMSPGEHSQYIDYILTVLEEMNSKVNKLGRWSPDLAIDVDTRIRKLGDQVTALAQQSPASRSDPRQVLTVGARPVAADVATLAGQLKVFLQ